MVNFFEKRSRLPSFKSKRGVQSATFSGASKIKFDASVNMLALPQIGSLEVVWTRELPRAGFLTRS